MPEASEQPRVLHENAAQDFGFGVAIATQSGTRLVNHDGSFNVLRNRKTLLDHLSYATLLNLRWPAFFGLVMLAFVALNLLFGVGYLLCGSGALRTAGPDAGVGRFWQAFFFSVHTFSTIGYGNIVPVGLTANLLVVLEAVTGLLSAALITGLVFARFSKPNVRIRFSARGVLRLGDKPAVLVRLRNLTRSEVLDLEATLMAWFIDPADHKTRHFHLLATERAKITFLPLSWTVAHFITPESPFYGLTKQQFLDTCGEVLLQVRGIDQNSSQAIYARVSYTAAEIAWNARYADHYVHDSDAGTLGIDSELFDTVISD
ncbi:MAG: ion channel [Janthinobacterium lividum]